MIVSKILKTKKLKNFIRDKVIARIVFRILRQFKITIHIFYLQVHPKKTKNKKYTIRIVA